MTWQRLDAELATASRTVSVCVGRLGAAPAYTRLPDVGHYAASTMKLAVLTALHRAAEAGALDLDAPVPVHNAFDSAAAGAPRFACTRRYDNDDVVWERIGATAPLRWLAERMIVKSSNLATNLVLAHVGLPAVARVWDLVGARHSVTGRGIEDFAARDAGITNEVTAADLAALLSAIARGATAAGPCDAPVVGPDASRRMLDVLFRQEHREDLAAGLPPGTRIAHKNGWVHGVRHGAGVVFPDDAPPYAVVACTTTTDPADERGDDDACRLIARISATAWTRRHELTPTGAPAAP
ncbi:beta-lactamase class A [Micromonospora pattaloongensis]|uniref:Beta-lactamase class A n=1 Tax=Micromonospora pattaloongensis TaxID=405436 RepID=A0A1H3Q901_9ACTN|nr:serine hydrolase [Micromonospora pattaloongensis]SDZ09753.1 beta-lactamase class A [Micromonospora pattaloongensis]